MDHHKDLKHALTGLAKLQIALSEKGGPTKDGQMFELILKLQGGILGSLGLPESPDNEKLIFFKTVPTDEEVKSKIEQLHQVASKFLLSDAKPDLQILREAQEFNHDPFSVLPELNIASHTYTIFVFNNILLKKADSVENVLHEFRFINHDDLLDVIGNLAMNNYKNPKEVIEKLKASGVKYIDQFVLYNKK